MSCFWAIILSLTFAFTISSEAKKSIPPSAVIIGAVYCDACFFPKHSHFIAGASVSLECSDETTSSTFRKELKTDEHGEFKVKLPFQIEKHTKKIKGCSVKLISSNKPYCSIPSSASSSSFHLRSRKRGIHVFSAGSFTFKPSKAPCDQNPNNVNTNNIKKLKKLSPYTNPDDPSFPPPLRDPPPTDPPALGHLLPPLPPLLPGIPLLPPKGTNKIKQSLTDDNVVVNQSDIFPFPPNPLNPPNIFPPNPLQPPPSLIPPVIPTPPPSLIPPMFPTPPPSVIPPIFPLPSPPPFFQLPPLPGLTPSPPPPPPPVFPVPLPPFPFQPSPGFPGIPPAEVSERRSP